MRTAWMVRAGVAMMTGAMMTVATPLVAQRTAPVPAAVTHALADPARADQAGDDARRQAAAMLAFSGVRPGDTVVDYLPGRYYWTRILAGVVGPRGRVIAMFPPAAADRAIKALPDTLGKWKLANVSYVANPGNVPGGAKDVDLFWTVQNYHDIANKGANQGADKGGDPALAAFNAGVFALLKHGGTYVVIDHADAPGTGITGTDTRHRIDPAAVKRQVEAAGFRYVGQSTALANPADDHRANVFDPAIRGHTDQFAFKFRKP